jgi:hypothetical protein
MRRVLLSLAAVAALGVCNAAHAANPCLERMMDFAKMLGHANGLAEASQIIAARIDKEPKFRETLVAYNLAEQFRLLALAKQTDAEREFVAYKAAGCK